MNDSAESIWIEQYFNIVKDTFKEKKFQKMLDKAFELYHYFKGKPFIFCLSEKNDLLSQWRAYSDNGNGVCIGFSTKELGLEKHYPTTFNIDPKEDCTIGILPIEYNSRKQKKIILDSSNKCKKRFDKNKLEDLYYLLNIYASVELTSYSLTFKNPSFSEENEWRIIHIPSTSKDYEKTETEKNISDIKFRVSNSKIVTYHEYDLSKIFNSNLIQEIVLGPKSKIDIPELEEFLKHHKLGKTKISRSGSTYR